MPMATLLEFNKWAEESKKKHILGLYRHSDRISPMFMGSDEIDLRKYKTIDEAKLIIDDFFTRIY